MRKKEIMELTGAGDATITRWMRQHPKLSVQEPDTKVGHRFPAPIAQIGRAFIWDEHEVREWWDANHTFIGRHAEAEPAFTMPADKFARFLLDATAVHDGADEPSATHLERSRAYRTIRTIQPKGEDVRLSFGSVSDAVHFRLKHS